MRTLARFAFALAVASFALPLTAPAQTAQGTAFTYQGQLLQNNAPVTGNTAMTFTLWDSASGGNVIGTQVFDGVGSDPPPVSVVDGIFTVTLDFGGSAFFTIGDDARWLQVEVGTTVLSPRTAIENAPYALTSQLAYNVPANSIGTTQIIAAQVQQRVTGTCASGAISAISQTGTVSCQTSGSGTITGVTAGTGLSGGGTAGTVSLSADTTYLQRRVTGTCASGSSISSVNADGTVACQSAGTGSVTSVTAGFGLAGGTITGSGIIDVDTNVVATKANTWSLNGNAGVGSGFLGTTDNNALTFKVNGTQVGQLQPTTPTGSIVYTDTPNVIFGSSANSVDVSVYGATIGGGGDRHCYPSPCTPNPSGNRVSGSFGTIAGGESNWVTFGSGTIGGGLSNKAYDAATVAGGADNSASDYYATVAGGIYNAAAYAAAVPGGYFNTAGGNYSLAAGTYAHVRSASDIGSGNATGDQGTFVWSDSTGSNANQFTSSGINQFLIRAGGGVGINTTPYNPEAELTIQGSATAGSTNADIVLLPRNSFYGFNVSVSGTAQSDAAFAIETTANNFAKVFGIDASGNATVTQGNLTLAGATAQAYKPGGGSWAAPSDVRLKRDVRPLDHVLDRMLQLHGVTFEYANPDDGLHPAGRHTGFIAQQVQQVFPDWVGQTPDGYLSVGPQGFEAMTVEALRELRAEKDAEIIDLRARLERIEARLDAREIQP